MCAVNKCEVEDTSIVALSVSSNMSLSVGFRAAAYVGTNTACLRR